MTSILDTDHPFVGATYWILRKTIGPIVRALFIRTVTGLENIPAEQAAVIALNHQSFFDFLCFSAISPRNVHFLSAEKFFSHPLWSILMRLTGQIKVEREAGDKASVHASVAKHVWAKSLIGIFPEGTRSPSQHEMLPAYTGVARYALEHQIPIIPVGIRGTHEIMSKGDTMPKIRKIAEIHIGAPMHFPSYHNKHEDAYIRTTVTESVMKEIGLLSGKTYPHHGSAAH